MEQVSEVTYFIGYTNSSKSHFSVSVCLGSFGVVVTDIQKWEYVNILFNNIPKIVSRSWTRYCDSYLTYFTRFLSFKLFIVKVVSILNVGNTNGSR